MQRLAVFFSNHFRWPLAVLRTLEMPPFVPALAGASMMKGQRRPDRQHVADPDRI